MPRSGPDLIRADLCDQATRLARGLATIPPGEPEAAALLDAAVRSARPDPYQLHAAIAACHSAVAMADGPIAGLAILDGLRDRLSGWTQFHIARAELLREAGDTAAAARAYQAALGLGMSAPQRAFVESRAADLLARGIRVCER